ncbi:hypothetical protein KI387_016203, partial [Taxus chinensis]
MPRGLHISMGKAMSEKEIRINFSSRFLEQIWINLPLYWREIHVLLLFSGFAYVAARATTSEETSTVVSKQLEALPVREEIPEESSADVSQPFEVVSAGEEIPEESSSDVTELFDNTFADLKRKFDATEDKSTLLIYGSAAVVALLVSGAVVNAIDSIPLLPKAMEFVGFGYTVWFVYRYLLYK